MDGNLAPRPSIGGLLMWVLFAFGSALFAGITAILAKLGIKHTDSTVATAIRTIVVLVFSWLMVAIVGSAGTIGQITPHTWLFLILSGLATGASWLCYFHALQIGDVNKVVPVDKASTVLTIILAFIFLGEPITPVKGVAVVAIGIGTYLMIQRKPDAAGAAGPVERAHGSSWLLFAAGSAVFAALTAILGKVGIEGVESNLGTAIRTCVVLVMSWVMVFATGKQGQVRTVERNELGFICLSGLATGASWLCYYKALQDGLASVVVPIDKLSILVTIAFSYVVFHERLSRKAAVGLALIVGGTLAMLVA
ncbi:MAG: EamA family transporter [Atopobiaceae bacterium]|nr:EamA family transporter [Atopobiaceae bacterium]MCH4214272.1 EamA family transporter [Atopobiaceae bacterium]MCH4229431.1 EamA family transporter [Atopobiaceae bacterium]MCH4276097.1 EamA family transporter [Atopobiaceae bacterium]MCI1226876.1 EamA family transporter [Atopobiaceae bacterium]